MNQKQLIILTGPTAVGKTSLSIRLAKRIGGEIISADSMQVYRGLDIGSAKIMPDQMDGVRHHLIDVLDPQESFDVTMFQHLAKDAIQDIRKRGHIPILVGGTGFYIQSVVYDIDFTQQDPYRLHEMLKQVDPDAAAKIHPNNNRRTIRALEFWRQTGERISQHNQKEREKESPYLFCYFVLTQDRAKIYEKIDLRVDQMLEDGLEGEVRSLKTLGLTPDMTSMKGLGYAEMLRYLSGDIPYEEAVRLIKRNTRHFAKRQLTWFRRNDQIRWLKVGYSNKVDKLSEKIEIMMEKNPGICYNEA